MATGMPATLRCLGMGAPGDQITEIGGRGERITGDTFVILFNARHLGRSSSASAPAGATCAGRACSIPRRPTPHLRQFEHMAAFPLQARVPRSVLRAEILSTSTSP